MRKSFRLFLVFCAVLAVGVVPVLATTQLTFATGGTSGTYYPLGGGMAKLWNAKVAGVNVSVQATGASVENIRLIAKKQVDLAYVQNDINHYAYNGIEIFKEKITDFAVIAALYPEVVQVVVSADSKIKSVADLRGKRVSVGAPGSGVEANARQILSIYKLDYTKITPLFLSFAESADQFKNGQCDAFFVVAGVPNSAIQDVAAQHKIRILDFSNQILKKLANEFKFFSSVTIPANTYKGQTRPVKTVAVKATLICRPDLDDELVYNLTKVLFENLGEVGHAKAGEISLKGAVVGVSTPFHPGALKYFKEMKIK
ncbi:MAG: TAXI family TRAP transporter solute-binding subunit [Bacteroidota bacterium]